MAVPERAGELQDAPTRMDRAPDLRLVVTNCYEPGPHMIPATLAAGKDLPFLRVEPNDHKAQMRGFAPGLMVVEGAGSGMTEFVFAQAASENWRVKGGEKKAVAGGLLWVKAESGRAVRLQYWNSLRMQGLVIQFLVLIWLISKASRGFSQYSIARQTRPS